jgi:hypothetical protein
MCRYSFFGQTSTLLFFARWLIAAAALCAAGCQRTPVTSGARIRGAVTSGGRALEVAGRDIGLGMVQVGFWPVYEDGQELVAAAMAQADEQGNFQLVDPLPAGKYLITVRQWDPYPNVDKLQGKFDERNSKIVRQIDSDLELIIDVAQPRGGL